MRRTYNTKAYDPFQDGQIMDYCTAKGYIDEAWEKRADARKALKAFRDCDLTGDMRQSSYFCAVLKNALRDYKKAQRLGVRAFHKCMADTKKHRMPIF